MQDIHDIEPPVLVGMDPVVVQSLLVMAAVLIAAAAGWLVWSYWKRRRALKKINDIGLLPPPPPADEAALKALAALGDPAIQDPRQFYFAVTAILKTFMGKVFHMGIPEMTTQEVLATLPQMDLDKSLAARTREFFQSAAMVKYAGVVPETAQPERDHAFVGEFVRRVTEKINTDKADAEDVLDKKAGNGRAPWRSLENGSHFRSPGRRKSPGTDDDQNAGVSVQRRRS